MLPVAEGEAVSAVVAEWVRQPIAGVATVPFDPPGPSFNFTRCSSRRASDHRPTRASATARLSRITESLIGSPGESRRAFRSTRILLIISD